MELNAEYGKEFAKARIAAGHTQGLVSQALGMKTPQYISNVERGKCFISVEHYKPLQDVIGKSAVEKLVDLELRIRARKFKQKALGK